MLTNKTYIKWMRRVEDKQTPWTEDQIIYFRKAVSRCSKMDPTLKDELLRRFQVNVRNYGGYKITPEQTEKGIGYLRLKCFGKRGTTMFFKRNFIGPQGDMICQDFSHFELSGLDSVYNGMGEVLCWNPIYKVVAKDGSSFEYTGISADHPLFKVSHIENRTQPPCLRLVGAA